MCTKKLILFVSSIVLYTMPSTYTYVYAQASCGVNTTSVALLDTSLQNTSASLDSLYGIGVKAKYGDAVFTVISGQYNATIQNIQSCTSIAGIDAAVTNKLNTFINQHKCPIKGDELNDEAEASLDSIFKAIAQLDELASVAKDKTKGSQLNGLALDRTSILKERVKKQLQLNLCQTEKSGNLAISINNRQVEQTKITDAKQCTSEIDLSSAYAKMKESKSSAKEGITLATTILEKKLNDCAKVYQKSRITTDVATRAKYRDSLIGIKEAAEKLATSFLNHIHEDTEKLVSVLFTMKSDTDAIIAKVNKLVEFDVALHEIPPWNTKATSFQFYSGLEVSSINKFLEETHPRLGMQIYTKWTNKTDFLRNQALKNCSGFKRCSALTFTDVHTYFNASFTTLNERKFVQVREDASAPPTDTPTDTPSDMPTDMPNMPATGNDEPEEAEPSSEQAIVIESGLFYPIYSSIRGDYKEPDYQEYLIGPIVALSAYFTDTSQDQFTSRYYLGARMANNEETYFDLLFGGSEHVDGLRMELRGQFPVTTLGGGRVFLGGKFNTGIDSDKKKAKDAWQIFLQWQVNFDELWQRSE
jgi:hypothetical protein